MEQHFLVSIIIIKLFIANKFCMSKLMQTVNVHRTLHRKIVKPLTGTANMLTLLSLQINTMMVFLKGYHKLETFITVNQCDNFEMSGENRLF